MRARKWRGKIWAARLGLLALALNALVPVHLAFDLAEAFEPAHQCGTNVEVDNRERQLLAAQFSRHALAVPALVQVPQGQLDWPGQAHPGTEQPGHIAVGTGPPPELRYPADR